MAKRELRSAVFMRRPRRLLVDRLEARELLSVSPGTSSAALASTANWGFSRFNDTLGNLTYDYGQYVNGHGGSGSGYSYDNTVINRLGQSIWVEASASGATENLVQDFTALGGQYIASFGHTVSGLLPISVLPNLNNSASLQAAWPVERAQTHVGIANSQGDINLAADKTRVDQGLDGTGVTVGILSDSFNALGTADRDVATSDLPPLNQIKVLADLTGFGGLGGGTDEGRAIAQIVHDVAPGATLAFHTAEGGQTAFAAGILRLANEANAKVIIDDVSYFAEPFFQDGIIAQAVDQVKAQGVSYFSSAGNNADNSTERDFWSPARHFAPPDQGGSSKQLDGTDSIAKADDGTTFLGGETMSFAGGDDLQAIEIPKGGSINYVLQWDQPFFSLSGVGSVNDLDFYLLDEQGTKVVAASRTTQIRANGTTTGQDPIEQLFYFNPTDSGDTKFNLMIVKRPVTTTVNATSTDTPIAIADGATVQSHIGVASAGTVNTVTVTLNLQHATIGDLSARLIAPDGTTVELFASVGGAGNNMLNTTFSDDATRAITAGTAPFNGTFKPTGTLADLVGVAAGGDWQLEVEDKTGNLGGTLLNWTLHLGTSVDASPDPGIIKYIAEQGSVLPSEYMGFASTIVGHSNAAGAFSVAAMPYNNGPGFGDNQLLAEGFSSWGGTPILFDLDGVRVQTPIDRAKPDAMGPDGGDTTFFPPALFVDPTMDPDRNGLPNFFGTSASAPHVAAVAALMLQSVPQTTPDEVYEILKSTAIPSLSPDFIAGTGLVQADTALEALNLRYPGTIEGDKFNDLNGNGQRDSGEPLLVGFDVFLDKNNDGVRQAGGADKTDTFTVDRTSQPLVIPDNSTVRSQQLVNNLSGLLTDVNVTVDIDHASDRDLQLTLISPSGRRILLVDRRGGNGDNFTGTKFDDQAGVAITAGAASFTGSFRPEQPLSSLIGEDPNGLWTLEMTDLRAGTSGTLKKWSLDLKHTDTVAQSFAAREVPIDIEDANATLPTTGVPSVTSATTTTSRLFVGDIPAPITAVNLSLDIDHTAVGDLQITLISPTGTRVLLSNQHGGTGDDYSNTTFDDAALNTIASGAAPFAGSFRPDAALSALAGENANGYWKLEIVDKNAFNVGTLNSWTLRISYAEPKATTNAEGHYNFKGLPPGNAYNVVDALPPGWTSVQTEIQPAQTGPSPVLFTEMKGTSPNGFELENVSNQPVDVTDWYVVVSDAPFSSSAQNNINSINATARRLVPARTFNSLQFQATLQNIASQGTVQSQTVVSNMTGDLSDVTVDVNLVHPATQDLELVLVSPSGKEVRLIAQNGASGPDLRDTVFDDRETGAIGTGTAPYTGRFAPAQPLSGFAGEDPNGTWTLRVINHGTQVGVVEGWSLDVTTEMQSRAISYSTDSPSDQYFGSSIYWNRANGQNGSGWAMLVDNTGKVRDWVGWGWTAEELAGFNLDTTVTLEDGSERDLRVVSLSGSWNGGSVQRSGLGSMQRQGDSDTNTAADWQWFSFDTIGTENTNLLKFPFLLTQSPDSQSLFVRATTDLTSDLGNRPANLTVPFIYAASPTGVVDGPQSTATFDFSIPMNADSFNIADDVLSFTRLSDGADLKSAIIGFTWESSNTRLRLNFNSQNIGSDYRLILGPNILATSGTALDQNGNGTPGEAADGYTLNFSTRSQIGGLVYSDLNGNGVRDVGEPVLTGRTVFIDLDGDGSLDAGEQSTKTDANGRYTFSNLAGGTYTVVVVVPAGFSASSPADGKRTITFGSGPADTVELRTADNFGLKPDLVAWQTQGPAVIINGQVRGLGNSVVPNPVIGAIRALLVDPSDPSVVYAGTVNGGVWRTRNATSSTPIWTPLTDDQPSLSIGALEFDATDVTHQTIVAGIGRFSSLSGDGGSLTGLLRSRDGGDTWEVLGNFSSQGLAGKNVSSLAVLGPTIMVGVDKSESGPTGIYRSIDDGQTFSLLSGDGVSGLPLGAITDLQVDPGDPFKQRMFAAVLGQGVYRSTDGGAHWTGVNTGITGVGATTDNLRLALHSSPGNSVIYVGVINDGQLAGVFRSSNQGDQWTPMDLPVTNEADGPVGLNPEADDDEPGGQGALHFSIAADRTNPNVVFVGGDRQPDPFPNSIGATNFTGRLFRGDASAPAGSQWTAITDNGAQGTAPHADSRDLVMDSLGNLLEADDGGIYVLANPNSASGRRWASRNGNLQITEFHSIAYDPHANQVFGGTQDVGTAAQVTSNGLVWNDVTQGDGGKVADDALDPLNSYAYTSNQFLQNFTRTKYSVAYGSVLTEEPALRLANNPALRITDVDAPQFYSPIAVNSVVSGRLLIATETHLFESSNLGETFTELKFRQVGSITDDFGAGAEITALAYGGSRNGSTNASITFVGAGAAMFRRTTATGALVALPNWSGGQVDDIVVDPQDWHQVYALSNDKVYASTDGGDSWNDITGNLGFANIRTIAFARSSGAALVLVGGDDGVAAMVSGTPGSWLKLSEGLPGAPVTDLVYSAPDDVLIAGTLGRGSWKLQNFLAVVSGTTQFTVPTPTPTTGLGGLPAALNLGVVSHTSVATGASGDQWYQFQPSQVGLITAMVGGSGASLQLFDSSMHAIGSSPATGATSRLDASVQTGQTYYLRVSGAAPQAQLQLGNLVTQTGDVVEVHGSEGRDQFSLVAGSDFTVSINGVSYHFDRAQVHTINFHGDGGQDTATFSTTSDNLSADLSQGLGSVTGPGYKVNYDAVASIRVDTGTGRSQAVLRGSSGDDVLNVSGGDAQLAGSDYLNLVHGFQLVRATSGGGNDAATLQGTTASEQLTASPTEVQLASGPNAYFASGFKQVRVFGNGGSDTANFTGSQLDDQLLVTGGTVQLSGANYSNYAKGFGQVQVQGGLGRDTAQLYGSTAADQLMLRSDLAQLVGSGLTLSARGFEEVRAYGQGGADQASVYVPAGGQVLGQGGRVQISGGGLMGFVQQFGNVRVYGQGTGAATLYGASTGASTLSASGGAVRFETGQGVTTVYNLPTVKAFATPGTQSTASLVDSALDNHLDAQGSQASLSSGRLAYSVYNFSQVTANTTGQGTKTVKATDYLLETFGNWLENGN